jgi:hypothetical protein
VKITLTNSTRDDHRALLSSDITIEIVPGAAILVRSVRLVRSPGGMTFLSWPRTRRGNDFISALVFKGPLVSMIEDEVLERMRVAYRTLATLAAGRVGL